jgi:glutaredoxin-like protein NrdH
MKIVVYGREACIQCRYTRNEMHKLGLRFEDRDVTKDSTAASECRQLGRELGFNLPIVVVSHTHGQPQQRWAGFNPDRIRGLIT